MGAALECFILFHGGDCYFCVLVIEVFAAITLIDINNPLRNFSSSFFKFFFQESQLLQRLAIPQFEALIMDRLILEEQSFNIIRGRSGPLSVKSVLYRKKGRGKPLTLLFSS